MTIPLFKYHQYTRKRTDKDLMDQARHELGSDGDDPDSGFLDGLKVLGLFNEDSEDLSKSQKSPAPKATGRPPIRRRPPTRTPMVTINQLLDGLDVPGQNTSLDAFTLGQPVHGPHGQGSGIEVSIQNYLSASFQILKEDFRSEFERMMMDCDSIDRDVERFLIDLKGSLRDVFANDSPTGHQMDNISPILDSILPAFRDVFALGYRQTNSPGLEEIENLNLARVGISSCAATMQSTFSSVKEELSLNISHLNQLQNRLHQLELKAEEQGRIANESRTECECQKTRKEIELATISELKSRVASLRKILKFEEDDDFYAFDDSNSKRIRNALARLRKSAQHHICDPFMKLRECHRKFQDYRDEAACNRDMILFQNQRFVALCNAVMSLEQNDGVLPARTVTEVGSPHVSFIDANLSGRRDVDANLNVRRDVDANFYGRRDVDANLNGRREVDAGLNGRREVDAGGLRSPLISSLKQRLKILQERREADLLNTASFLEAVRRDEKRRIRAELAPE
jgi:hypothetical protein